LTEKVISKVVLVISRYFYSIIDSRETGKILERWTFDISIKDSEVEKSNATISAEISAVLRQITASVSFLPVLSEPCTFNILGNFFQCLFIGNFSKYLSKGNFSKCLFIGNV
jgi:mitotic spindle assembly checkpoint protein MAD2